MRSVLQDYADELAMALDILKLSHCHFVGETCEWRSSTFAIRPRLTLCLHVRSSQSPDAAQPFTSPSSGPTSSTR